jgi:hypothetical protein
MTMTNTTKLNNGVFLWLFSLLFALFTHSSFAADTKDWLSSKETNMAVIDHQLWQTLLDKYLISNDPSGVNLFDYKKVSSKDKVTLEKYLTSLQTKDPRAYNKGVQKAYWINLYNALTVQLILDNYPVKSITKLGKKFLMTLQSSQVPL